MGDIKNIKIKLNFFSKRQATIFGQLLPTLIVMSFLPQAFYAIASNSLLSLNDLSGRASFLVLSLECIAIACLQYLLFRLILWVYKSVLKTKPYFYLINEQEFSEKLSSWYLLKNIIISGFYVLLIYYPYIYFVLSVISILLSYLVVTFTYLTISRKIDITFRPMFYRLMMTPWFIYQIFIVVLQLILGGLI